MRSEWNRREILKGLAAASTAILVPREPARGAEKAPGSARPSELHIAAWSAHTLRLSLFSGANPGAVPADGSVVQAAHGFRATRVRAGETPQRVAAGNLRLDVSFEPFSVAVADAQGKTIQQFSYDENSGALLFSTGSAPLYGLGEGGAQFDRRGSVDAMKSGQGGYRLRTHGARVPVPWIVSTEGWAIFFHQPHGTFDLSGAQGKFQAEKTADGLPLDLFFISAAEPATILAEYARITGHPEKPALWTLGYQQSHRTLASREEVLAEAKTFREKKLPCDAMIYLSTGFCPSGWNTENGSFVWNSRVFPDPKAMIDTLHQDHFRAVVHVVILPDRLTGNARDACDVTRFDNSQAGCHWDEHRRDFAMGIDGWWPDEGDPLDIRSRLVRNRMYWEGPQMDRPNERPYALHRNGYAGMQRYGSFLWSGDVFSTWETLQTQIPVAINTGLSGIPLWGTDIGGFVPTREFSAELYVRWFQFGAFCPLFRSHGRAWKLRLPWGWNTGDPGPIEMNDPAVVPDASQLHDERVEPICRKYLELRYRLLPYLYSMVHESAVTGLPILRALWLHFPLDPRAVACGDQYLWGGSLLVAPVVEQGATVRHVYLPPGDWYDFWTGERLSGGRETSRAVGWETMPLYVRAGSILPLGPVKQHVHENGDGPLSLTIYPGADATFLLYEDDGISFNYRKGEWTGIAMSWNDADQTLDLKLAAGSRMLAAGDRTLEVRLGAATRSVTFGGKPVRVSFGPDSRKT